MAWHGFAVPALLGAALVARRKRTAPDAALTLNAISAPALSDCTAERGLALLMCTAGRGLALSDCTAGRGLALLGLRRLRPCGLRSSHFLPLRL